MVKKIDLRRRQEVAVSQILRWADAYHRHAGEWPTLKSGRIRESRGETWAAMDAALRKGLRGLPVGSSLARLLAQERGVRNPQNLPKLTRQGILAWADAYHQRCGSWPMSDSGPIPEAPGETWAAVDRALTNGLRGLAKGSSLVRLLAEARGKRNRSQLPDLTSAIILAWADAHHQRSGRWPNVKSGPVPDSPGETWAGIDAALSQGFRGLPGGTTLAQLLAEERGVRNRKRLPAYTEAKILAWAEAHRRRTGRLPTAYSGPIMDAPGETWRAVEVALRQGRRGLPGGSSLYQLLHWGRAGNASRS
jgi:hypothetical protein